MSEVFYKVKNKKNHSLKITVGGEKWISPLGESILNQEQYEVAKDFVDVIETLNKTQIQTDEVEIELEDIDYESVIKSHPNKLKAWLKKLSSTKASRRKKLLERALIVAADSSNQKAFNIIKAELDKIV